MLVTSVQELVQGAGPGCRGRCGVEAGSRLTSVRGQQGREGGGGTLDCAEAGDKAWA